jgi:hypothetical protein
MPQLPDMGEQRFREFETALARLSHHDLNATLAAVAQIILYRRKGALGGMFLPHPPIGPFCIVLAQGEVAVLLQEVYEELKKTALARRPDPKCDTPPKSS